MKQTGSDSRRIKRATRADFEVSWRGQFQLGIAWVILAVLVMHLQPVVGSDIVDPRIVDLSVLATGYVLSAAALLVIFNVPAGRQIRLHKHPERDDDEALPPMQLNLLPPHTELHARTGMDLHSSALVATLTWRHYLSPRLLQSPTSPRA